MLKEQGFLQQSSSPLETKPCTVVFKNGRKLAIVGLLQLLVSLVVVGFGIGSAFLWEKPLKKSCDNYDPQATTGYRVTIGIEIEIADKTENIVTSTESSTTELQTSSTTTIPDEKNELISFLIVQKFTIDFSKLDPYDKLQDIEDLLKDRIPVLNEPELIKYLKPYILAKLDDNNDDQENDPAVVIIEDSDDVIAVDVSGEGSQEASGAVSKRQLRNQAYAIDDQDKVDKISKIVSRAVDEDEYFSEQGSVSSSTRLRQKKCDKTEECRTECPVICEARYNFEKRKFAVLTIVLAATLLSIPVIAGLFGLISGCMLKKRHTKNLSVLQPPLSKSASVSYLVFSALAALSDCALNILVSIFLYQTLFVLTMETEDVPKCVVVIALWIFLIIAFILNLSLVVYGMMCSCCFNSAALVQGCTADGNEQKRAKSTFSMSFSNKTFPTLATPMNSVMSFHSCPPYMQESNPVFTDWSIFQNKETLPAPEDEEIILGHNYTPKSRLEEIPPFPLDESIKDPSPDQLQKF